MIPVKRTVLHSTTLSVSDLCLGAASFGDTISERDTFALLDRYLELGGNFIDTARVYSDWAPGEARRSERVLGDWLKARSGRNGLVIATKGGHPFLSSPDTRRTSAEELRDDLEGSLRTLRIETVDVYWLHRDDPTRPVEHFIDVLNAFRREGKIRALGASNWTVARLRAANDYAERTGQSGFAASQPFWCLGCRHLQRTLFPGGVTFGTEEEKFHRDTGLAVMPYTPQAQGFFSKYARLPAERRPELAQSAFYTPQNRATAEAAMALAAEHSTNVTAIVLAYLRARPFPVVPILGCRTIAQLEDSFGALQVSLTPAEVQRLASLHDSRR